MAVRRKIRPIGHSIGENLGARLPIRDAMKARGDMKATIQQHMQQLFEKGRDGGQFSREMQSMFKGRASRASTVEAVSQGLSGAGVGVKVKRRTK